MKKVEFIFCEDKSIVSVKIGYSLGTVYISNLKSDKGYELFNFGYCPSIKDFYYNKNVHLPKKVVEYFESVGKSKIVDGQMRELGIYNKEDISSLLQEYNELQTKTEIQREKILNFKRTIKNKIQ